MFVSPEKESEVTVHCLARAAAMEAGKERKDGKKERGPLMLAVGASAAVYVSEITPPFLSFAPSSFLFCSHPSSLSLTVSLVGHIAHTVCAWIELLEFFM